MTKLNWDTTGLRFYETGVDRGVLYPKVGPGVPWNGLISVADKASGGGPVPYYMDGIKYINLSAAEEFEATIQALSSPSEFDISDGNVELVPGLMGTQQPRRPFGLTYRTGLGNDTLNLELGYQIHLVYDAMASPTNRSNRSIGDIPDPTGLSWDIQTVPQLYPGFRPSAHYVIDSTLTHPVVLADVEDMLYGSIAIHPTLPTPEELEFIFTAMVRGYGHGPYGHGPYGYGP